MRKLNCQRNEDFLESIGAKHLKRQMLKASAPSKNQKRCADTSKPSATSDQLSESDSEGDSAEAFHTDCSKRLIEPPKGNRADSKAPSRPIYHLAVEEGQQIKQSSSTAEPKQSSARTRILYDDKQIVEKIQSHAPTEVPLPLGPPASPSITAAPSGGAETQNSVLIPSSRHPSFSDPNMHVLQSVERSLKTKSALHPISEVESLGKPGQLKRMNKLSKKERFIQNASILQGKPRDVITAHLQSGASGTCALRRYSINGNCIANMNQDAVGGQVYSMCSCGFYLHSSCFPFFHSHILKAFDYCTMFSVPSQALAESTTCFESGLQI